MSKKAKAQPTAQGASKKATIINMLESKEGASIAEIQKATGWQPHSVRGSLVHLKNKDKLPITSSVAGGTRYYRIEKAGA